MYIILDENDRIVSEFESLEAGVSALAALEDGEAVPYSNGEGYYTDHYHLEKGFCYLIAHGRSTLQFKDDASVKPLTSERLGIILSQQPTDEFTLLLRTADGKKAHAFFDELVPEPIKWNTKERTMVVDFYYLETDDSAEGDVDLFYKCPAFLC